MFSHLKDVLRGAIGSVPTNAGGPPGGGNPGGTLRLRAMTRASTTMPAVEMEETYMYVLHSEAEVLQMLLLAMMMTAMQKTRKKKGKKMRKMIDNVTEGQQGAEVQMIVRGRKGRQ